MPYRVPGPLAGNGTATRGRAMIPRDRAGTAPPAPGSSSGPRGAHGPDRAATRGGRGVTGVTPGTAHQAPGAGKR